MDPRLPLLGAWRLVATETRLVSGRVLPVRSDDGYLLYTTDGYMSVVLMAGVRARFGADNFRSGSADEKIQAFDSYFTYGGRYAVEGDIVTHHILFCLFPNWVGTDQVRRFALGPEGGILTLWNVNPLMIQGEEAYSRLTWRRA
jgi:hypothetical protein